MKKVSEEVLIADEGIVCVDQGLAVDLQRGAKANARHRMRLCAHPATDDRLHEMVIALTKDTYIRPHMHFGKSESMHVIDGDADLVIFNEFGEVRDVIHLGPYPSAKTFFVRLATPVYHMLLVRTEVFLVHETTNGPFSPAETAFAPWAPDGADAGPRFSFLAKVEQAVAALRRSAGKEA